MPVIERPLGRGKQLSAIFNAMECLDLINRQFSSAVLDILTLAALAFEDGGCGDAHRLARVSRLSAFLWSHAKGQLADGIKDSGLPSDVQAEWRTALAAVYRIAGKEDVAPIHGGAF